jgi:energy-coupling factor transporter ATP-binding protein EcfA2
MIQLPTIKQTPRVNNPKFLVYFGKPKSGKSTIASMLDGNLIIDLEHGYDYLEALVLQAESVEDLREIALAITAKNKEIGGYTYKYITIDNATKLEEMILPLALKLYRDTPMGKSYNDDVRKLANGAGYLYMREAFFKVIDMFKTLAPHLILIAHCADKMINKEGKELSEMSIDLTGKTSRLVAADADAIAYVYRKKHQTIMNFNGGDDVIVEARQEHLRGKEIIIAESDDKNAITAYWDRIFIADKEQ